MKSYDISLFLSDLIPSRSISVFENARFHSFLLSNIPLTEVEMVGWHHLLNGHEFEQTLGDAEGQGSLAYCSPWGCKESDTTDHLNSKTIPLYL